MEANTRIDSNGESISNNVVNDIADKIKDAVEAYKVKRLHDDKLCQ